MFTWKSTACENGDSFRYCERIDDNHLSKIIIYCYKLIDVVNLHFYLPGFVERDVIFGCFVSSFF